MTTAEQVKERLRDRVARSKSYFHEADRSLSIGGYRPDNRAYYDQAMVDSMPGLLAALELTRNLGEGSYQQLTRRRAFRTTFDAAELVFRRYENTIRFGEDHGFTLDDGLDMYQLEQCYRICDAAEMLLR